MRRWGIYFPSKAQWHHQTFWTYRAAEKEMKRIRREESETYWRRDLAMPIDRFLDYIVTRTNL